MRPSRSVKETLPDCSGEPYQILSNDILAELTRDRLCKTYYQRYFMTVAGIFDQSLCVKNLLDCATHGVAIKPVSHVRQP